MGAQWATLPSVDRAGGSSGGEAALPSVQPPRNVAVDIRQLSGSMREIWAAVEVAAPAELVWRTLTDYERLADIVPSLDENRILERWAGGVRLQQARRASCPPVAALRGSTSGD